MWILTYRVNGYEDYDDFFHTAFLTKPTIKELNDVSIGRVLANRLLKIGEGKSPYTKDWYYLKEYQHGE